MAAEQGKVHPEKIKECPICMDSFKNLKRLPCSHLYCLRCLEKYGEDERPGDEMCCPLCTQKFTIPLGGFAKLPDDDSAEQRFGGASNTSGLWLLCHVCSEKRATNYCAECAQDICDDCFGPHQNICNTRSDEQTQHKADLLLEFKSCHQELVSCFTKVNQCAEAMESKYELQEKNEGRSESSLSEAQQEIIRLKKEMRNLHSTNDQLRTKLTTTSSENCDLAAKLQKCNAEITSLKDHIIHITNQEIVGLKKQLDELEKKNQSLHQQLLFARNEAASLKEQSTTADKEESAMNKQLLNTNENISHDANDKKEQVIHLKEDASNLQEQNQRAKTVKERPQVPFRKIKQDVNTSRENINTETATMEERLTKVSKATMVLEEPLQKAENMTLTKQDEESENEAENPQQQFFRRPSNLTRLRGNRDGEKNMKNIIDIENKISDLREQLRVEEKNMGETTDIENEISNLREQLRVEQSKHREEQCKAEQESAKSKHEINRSKRYSLQR